MKQIPLTQGQFALVDDEDYQWLNQWKWQAQKGKTTFYAVRTDYSRGKKFKRLLYMHCEILDISNEENLHGDHKDRNGLNNQRSNLRIATSSQNNCNRLSLKNVTSEYKGVGWHKSTNKWCAYIGKGKDQFWLGLFDTEIEAAIAYNKKATQLHGEFAILNLISNEDSLKYNSSNSEAKTSKYKGVSWCNKSKRWIAKTQINGKHKYIGCFTSEIEAALAYNNVAKDFRKKLNPVN